MKNIYLSNLKILLVLIFVLSPVLFFGQNAKMWRQFNKVDIVATPTLLIEKGGWVAVEFDIVVPAGYFGKNAAMLIQPELRYKGGKTSLKPLTLKGDNVTGDGVLISHKDGGSYKYSDSFKYSSKFNRSELYIVSTVYTAKEGTISSKEEISENARSFECCHLYVADGVIYTAQRMLKDQKYIIADHGYAPKEVIDTHAAKVFFAVNKFNLNWNLKLNTDYQAHEKFNELTGFSNQGWNVQSISLEGWASPEGVSVNYKLSENRATVIYDEVVKRLNQLLEDGDGTFSFSNPTEDITYQFSYKGSDWDGFLRDLKASDISNKDAIYESIQNAGDEVAQDRALRRAMNQNPAVKTLLAPLRRTELAINYGEPVKTDAEVFRLALTNPDELGLRELLFAAAEAEDEQKIQIYEFIFEKIPKCWISKNNAAVYYMEHGSFDKAAELLNNAVEMYPDQGTVNANLGALALYNGEYDKAEAFFKKAKDNDVEVDSYNYGMLELAKGEYDKAADLLGSNSCDYNAGLAQLMAGDYTCAEATLKCTEEAPCRAAYLTAVIGARTNNAEKVFVNLKKAFEINPALKADAKDDREFMNYQGSEQFKALFK